MTEIDKMNQEIQAVKIRHKGQCPYEKDHEDYGSVFMSGSVIGAIIGTIMTGILMLISASSKPDCSAEAIQHGFAFHDPITGNFKWRSNP